MKKIVLGFVACIVVATLYMFLNKWHYPALPINDVTAKEVLQKIDASDEEMVQLATEGDIIWYITKLDDNGILGVNENNQQMLRLNGWAFKQQEGSGLFFEKDDERLIVTTEMWTRGYALVKVPKHYIE